MEKRITKKLLAILMIITILATDFYVLGSGLIAYAVDSTSVEISAYFKDEEGKKVHTINKSIKDENVKLYVDIKVNSGYFIGKELTIQNGNFNIKSSNEIKFNQINAGETATLELDIEPAIADKIASDLLLKTSTVVLTGDYTNSNSKSELETETISVTDEVTVNYQPNETIATELKTEIITNTVLAVNGTNKRIVQLLLKSRLTDNQYPVEYTTLNVSIPQLGDTTPEISVLALGKLATNGTTEISDSEYRVSDGNLVITLENMADVNNQISWPKNAYDELVVTFMYAEDVDASTVEITTNSEIKIHGSEGTKYSATDSIKIENQELNSVIIGKKEITTEELYKGQLYANTTATEKVNVEYETKTTLGITNTGVANQITIYEGTDTFGTEETELAANTRFVSTVIAKEKLIALFGDSATIEIKNGDKVINSNEVDGNIVATYPTDVNVSKIDIVITGQPISTGILEINHVKEITENTYTRAQLQTVKTLNDKGTTLATLDGTKIVENSTEASLELKETMSKVELSVSGDKLLKTGQTTENVGLTLNLVTNGEQYDLFKNPKITLQFPEAVENVEFDEIPRILNVNDADQIKITKYQWNPASKTVNIETEGEQTSYPTAATQLYIPLKLSITVSELVTTQDGIITMTYTNDNVPQYVGGTTGKIGISGPGKLVTMFNLGSNNTTSSDETITQSVMDYEGKTLDLGIVLFNDTGSEMKNVKILGKLPTTGNTIDGKEENTLETTLTNIKANGATVYYTENVNATVSNSNYWTQDLSSLTNAKLYLIELGTLSKGTYTAEVNVQIPNSINENALSYTSYQVIYDTDTETNKTVDSGKIQLASSFAATLGTTLTAYVGGQKIENGDSVKEGEVIKYVATVTNKSGSNLENVQLKASVPTGTVLVEPMEDYKYNVGYYDEKSGIAEKSISISLEEQATYAMEYEVRVNKGAANTEISNQAIVTYEDSTTESNVIKNMIDESNVRVTIKCLNGENTTISNIEYVIYIENLSNKKITDLEMKINSDSISVGRVFCDDQFDIFFEEVPGKIDISEIQANGIVTIILRGTIDENATEVNTSITVKDSNGTYRSNALKEVLLDPKAEITLTSNPKSGAKIRKGDDLTYTITIKNTGDVDGAYFTAKNKISDYLQIQEIKINGKTWLQTKDDTAETYAWSIPSSMAENIEVDIGVGETATIDIITKVVADESEATVINNEVELYYSGKKINTSNEVTHILQGSSTSETDIKNTISGLVWLDKDADKQKDDDETAIEGIIVKLYDISTKNYLTDENENVIQSVTNSDGKYTLSKVKDGSYRVVFEYDMNKYESTTTQLQNITINGDTVTVLATDPIKVQDHVYNVNIGLKEKSSSGGENPGGPVNPEGKNTISGFAWIDEDRDGQKDANETALPGIKVRLYVDATESYLKDKKGNIVEVTTNENGKYVFENIEKGKYIVLFEYDMEEYEPTKFMADGDSKVVLKEMKIDGEEKTFAVTDIINVQANVTNVNIGLKEKLIFDLELNKYISRIVVQNSKETKSYDYENKTLAKVEIHRKRIQGSLVVLEYTIKIKNNGEIAGYARNIVDYLPSGLTFSSELNKDWYLSENYLHTKGLENVEIKPGEEKEIKLILTKTMTSENAGLINNRAEIYQDYNKYGELDIDSTPNNQVQTEDDFDSVDVIIGIATGGSTIAYIILLMINIVLIGIAIRLMIRNNIIKISNKKERR